MKSKFGYLLKVSLKKKVDTKWFKVINVLLALLLIFLINIDHVISFFGGDFNEKDKIYVVDEAGAYDTFKNYFDILAKSLEIDNIEVVLDNNKINEKDDIDEDIILVIKKDQVNYITGEVISYDTVSRNTYEVIVNSLNTVKSEIALKESGISPDELEAITSPVNITETILDEDAKDNETREMINSVVTTIVVIPFFLLTVSMVQMIGAEINDEKSSRGMEIIVSSVPIKTHFLAKVTAALSFALIQGILMIVYAVLGIFIRSLIGSAGGAGVGSIITEFMALLEDAGIFNLLLKGCIPLIILFIFSFLAYAITTATLASMTTNNEDFQQLQTPLMLIMMIGYYMALMSVVFDGSLFINILGYVPLISIMIAPTLYLTGVMSLAGLCASALITVVTSGILYRYGLRIYKVGILNYSSSKLWKKMFKSLRKAK